jgi:hypothetical protein
MSDTVAVIEALERAPDIIVPLVLEVPPAILRRRPGPARWSAHEHACHLAGQHPLFFERLDRMLAEDRPRIVPQVPSPEEEAGALFRVDLGAALEQYVSERRRLIERLRRLRPEEWSRTADHGEYQRYSVFIMFRHMTLHEMLHAYRIEDLLLSRAP